MNSSCPAHDRLVSKIILTVGGRKDARAWENTVGIGRDINDNHIIKFGLKGSSDVIGILFVYGVGVFLGFEAKTGRAVQSPRQKKFEAMINRMGGFYFVVRETTDITACVEHARREVIERMKKVASAMKV
jgi:hypothetical protein